jgi:hypothetical protein|tara:strand:+ start:600 stop:908 length:309 start_codon:yes stop_codon:yes gene_type:complete
MYFFRGVVAHPISRKIKQSIHYNNAPRYLFSISNSFLFITSFAKTKKIRPSKKPLWHKFNKKKEKIECRVYSIIIKQWNAARFSITTMEAQNIGANTKWTDI